MIEGFILPESRAGAAKDKIRVPGRSAFDLLSDLCEWRMRGDQHVNVICHYDVRMQCEHFPLLSGIQGGEDSFGDTRIFQPKRAALSFVQNTIVTDEDFAA
jgi:hypothetical protein